ncbi:hypothetical protein D3C74_298590 [compost metagenome]
MTADQRSAYRSVCYRGQVLDLADRIIDAGMLPKSYQGLLGLDILKVYDFYCGFGQARTYKS